MDADNRLARRRGTDLPAATARGKEGVFKLRSTPARLEGGRDENGPACGDYKGRRGGRGDRIAQIRLDGENRLSLLRPIESLHAENPKDDGGDDHRRDKKRRGPTPNILHRVIIPRRMEEGEGLRSRTAWDRAQNLTILRPS